MIYFEQTFKRDEIKGGGGEKINVRDKNCLKTRIVDDYIKVCLILVFRVKVLFGGFFLLPLVPSINPFVFNLTYNCSIHFVGYFYDAMIIRVG